MNPLSRALLGFGITGVPFGLMYLAGALTPKASAPWALPMVIAFQMTCLAAGSFLALRDVRRRRRL